MAVRLANNRLLFQTAKCLVSSVRATRIAPSYIQDRFYARFSLDASYNHFYSGPFSARSASYRCEIFRRFSTSIHRYSTHFGDDKPNDYSSIPGLINEKLKSKDHAEGVFETQMDVLNKLILYKSGQESIDAVRSPMANLSHQHAYELAATVFGLVNTVGDAALEMSVPLFWLATLAGSTDAKYSYAKLLQIGQGVDADPIEAGKMFQELSEIGHPYAQFSLAQMYYSGVGVEQDFKLALSLFKVSAQNGILPAYTFLGNMYNSGQGVDEDQLKAFEFYQEGERKGDVLSMMALAYAYSHGQGVEVDHEKSFNYHVKAADKGYPAAQYNVGVHYFSGRGVTLDMQKSADCFKAAAEQGFELAQINLGNMYYNGLGVEKDLHKAKEWYQKAAEKNPNAKALLEEVEREINKK